MAIVECPMCEKAEIENMVENICCNCVKKFKELGLKITNPFPNISTQELLELKERLKKGSK